MRPNVLRFIPLLAMLVVFLFPQQASAGPRVIGAHKNCDTTYASLKVKETYTFHEAGKYYVKVQIRWDYVRGGKWRSADVYNSESGKYLRSPGQAIAHTGYDPTKWQGIYPDNWRAHVIFKAMKVRTGPDKTVRTDHSYFNKSAFKEHGSYCGRGTGGPQ